MTTVHPVTWPLLVLAVALALAGASILAVALVGGVAVVNEAYTAYRIAE